MGMFNVLDISASGMDVQQAKLEIAAANLANANTTQRQDGTAYKPLTAVVHSTQSAASFETGSANMPKPVLADVVESDLAPRLVYDPGHPDADKRGFVTLPGVDPIGLMLDLMSISRSYEANLRAFDLTRSLLQRTVEIGSRK